MFNLFDFIPFKKGKLFLFILYKMINILQTRYTIAQHRILLPTFMMGLLAASTAFGMWQGAWMGALFYAGAMAFMAAKIIDKPEAI